jgi:MFS family permease
MGVCLFPLFPLFYSTPIEIGGLGLDPFQIAICLSTYGIVNGIVQVLFFAKIVERFGPRSLILASAMIYPFVLALFPVMNLLSLSSGGSPAVWALLGLQLILTVGFDMCFGVSLAVIIFTETQPCHRGHLFVLNSFQSE